MKKTIDHLRATVSRRVLAVLSGVSDPIGPDGTPSEALRTKIAEAADRAALAARRRVDAELEEVRREIEGGA